MATYATPKFIGPIVVTAGLNDGVAWQETDGVDEYGLTTTIAAGTYWPTTLAAAIKAAMEARSIAAGLGTKYAGVGAVYTIAISDTDGIVTLLVSHAGCIATWFPRCTGGGAWNSVLTGGDGAVSTRSRNHFGFNRQVAFSAYSTGHISDVAHARCWYPQEPPKVDTEAEAQGFQASSSTISGIQDVADFLGDLDGMVLRTLEFDYIVTDSKDWWIDEFWRAYAKSGGYFRYHTDRTSVIYGEYELTGRSIEKPGFIDRHQGYPYFFDSIYMKEYRT